MYMINTKNQRSRGFGTVPESPLPLKVLYLSFAGLSRDFADFLPSANGSGKNCENAGKEALPAPKIPSLRS